MIPVDTIPAPRQRRRKGTTAPRAAGRCALYIRVSTDEQAADGSSLESQEAACRTLADRKGWDVARVFIDAGASGGRLERPGLDALRAAVAAGEVEAVAVYALDRLSRSQRDTLALLDEFAENGAGLSAASQDFDTTTPTGRAMLGMLAVFAELQREEIRARTRRALEAKRKRGESAGGRPPFGLERDGAGFKRNASEWPTVARILTARGGGMSCQGIADALNADGIGTPTAQRGVLRGKVKAAGSWSAATVAGLCRHPAVLAAVRAT